MRIKLSIRLLACIVFIACSIFIGTTVHASPMTDRYVLSNGYIYVSGVNGLIDTLKVCPDGTGNYSGNVIKNGCNFYMCTWVDSNQYIGNGSSGTWSINGNTLSLNDIQFGSTSLKGYWNITLSGDTMQSSYRIKNTSSSTIDIHSSRFKIEVPFDAQGYDVSDNTKIYFSKFITASDLYIDSRGLKRVVSDPSLVLNGDWVHAFGTNGYDLRFNPDSDFLEPINRIS